MGLIKLDLLIFLLFYFFGVEAVHSSCGTL